MPKGDWQVIKFEKNNRGKKFNRVTLVEATSKRNPSGKVIWKCLCECGKEFLTVGSNVKNGNCKSCGCWYKETRGKTTHKHGMAHTRIFKTWLSMMSRAHWKCPSGLRTRRGGYYEKLDVCKRWQKFENFYADMGERPENMTLDRIDNNKGYSPENCRWADNSTQARNKTNDRRWLEIVVDGVKYPSIRRASELTGIDRKKLRELI